MNPQVVLQERYPRADFASVFTFCEIRRGMKKENGKTHRHHYCPVAQFPEYEFDYPENIIHLTVEDHVEVHRLLGLIDPAMGWPCAAWIAAAAEGGRLGGPISGYASGLKHKEKGTGIFAPGMAAKGGRSKSPAKKVSAAVAVHIRWHDNRDVVNPECALCSGSVTESEYCREHKMNNIQSSLVELKINIQRASDTDRAVVREIYLRKSLELIDTLLHSDNQSTGNRGGVGKAEQSNSETAGLFPSA